MNAAKLKTGGLNHPVVWAAGFAWALLAATRWTVVIAAQEGSQSAVIWQWPPWWIPVARGFGHVAGAACGRLLAIRLA